MWRWGAEEKGEALGWEEWRAVGDPLGVTPSRAGELAETSRLVAPRDGHS